MKVLLLTCLVFYMAYVSAEKCNTRTDCVQTECHNEHGFWMHCMNHFCSCNHDTFIGANCTDGMSATCAAAAGAHRCTDHHMNWHCVDSTCHCAKI